MRRNRRRFFAVILLSLIVTCLVTSSAKADFNKIQGGNIERIHIFFVHPDTQTFVQITKKDIEVRCEHEVITENKFVIKRVIKGINEFLKWVGEEPSESSYRAKVKLHQKNGDILIVYLDNNEFFEFGNVKGKMPYEQYRQFMTILENLGDTVDMHFLKKLKIKLK